MIHTTRLGSAALRLVGRRRIDAILVMTLLACVPASAQTECDSTGPDVIVGEIVGVDNYTSVGGIEAFAVGTTSCNVGDEELLWISQSTQHPVIGQNLYRIKEGRCEQVGQAWLKHGFAALQGNACGCGCTPSGTGSRLGVGCSDPYSAGLNGGQNGLGPKSEVNAYTGGFQWVPTDFSNTGNSVYKRLQVAISDLDPAIAGGGTYVVEAQYVTPDDSAAGNQYNNCSWKEASVSGGGSAWSFSLVGSTHREEPAILAWEQMDPTVSSRAADVRGDGRFILAWKVTPLGGDQWNYELALYNMNVHRSASSLRVPLPAGTTVFSNGFHDVDYHSGEPWDGTDWAPEVLGSEISWATTPCDVDPDSNALRWGTLYNFRFVADASPDEVDLVEVGLCLPGAPGDPESIDIPMIPGAPSNDDCDSALTIASGATDFTTFSSTTDGPAEAGCDIGSDVWFEYTAPCTGDVTVSLCGSGFDTSVAIYDPDCPAGSNTAIACNDDFCGGQSELTIAASTGEMFLIRVGSPTGEQGLGTISIDCDGIVENNDNCVDAFPIGDGQTPYDTTEATTDGPAHAECAFDGQTYHDIWFTYNAEESGMLTVSTCGQADYDTDLAVYDGCDCSNLVLLDCNDDGAGCSGFTSEVTVTIVEGNCYLIRVGGWNDGDQGTGTLSVVGPGGGGPTGPMNDDCSDAIDVIEEVIAFNTTGSTTDGPDEPGACDFFNYTDVESDIWYRYTASCQGTATVSLCGSGYDTKLAVYDSATCPTAASAMACNDDACSLQSEVTFDSVTGHQYLIRVGGYNGAQGTGTMTISCEGVTITDCNDNGIDDALDIAKGSSEDCNGNENPDECDLAKGISADCDGGPVGRPLIGQQVFVANSCIGCHGPDGSGDIGPDIRNKTRVELWEQLLPPTDHFGGEFPKLMQQDFADLEGFLDTIGGSNARPDLVPDDCQALEDCDGDGVSDGCELEAGTQVDLDYDGTPDDCETPCPPDVNNDGVVDVDDLTTVILAWGSADPQADINDDGDVNVDDLTAVILGWGVCP